MVSKVTSRVTLSLETGNRLKVHLQTSLRIDCYYQRLLLAQLWLIAPPRPDLSTNWPRGGWLDMRLCMPYSVPRLIQSSPCDKLGVCDAFNRESSWQIQSSLFTIPAQCAFHSKQWRRAAIAVILAWNAFYQTLSCITPNSCVSLRGPHWGRSR